MGCAVITFMISFAIHLLLIGHALGKDKDDTCGFPGTPAHGYVKPKKSLYAESDTVFYTCRVGYILIGSPIRRCTESGDWTKDVPICDDSMTTLSVAFSTPTVPGHSAELAIDRNKETCSYLKPNELRWWNINLGDEHKVLSVAVTINSPDKFVKFTVFVVKIQGTDAFHKICATFTGKFGTQTAVLACADGKGLKGQKVHIEDHLKVEGFFELCEVEVQVEKATGYHCGYPDRNPYSKTYEPEGDRVEYECIKGYELIGRDYRTCESSGQWSGKAPLCKPIICDELDPLENGNTTIEKYNEGPPLEGSIAFSKCDVGYKLVNIGTGTRYCLKDGSWSEKSPQCRAIKCRIPDGKNLGGFYRLTNITNNMDDMAELICRKGSKREGNDPFIICTKEGEWTKTKVRCIPPKAMKVSYESATAPRIMYHEAIIFGKVVAGFMIVTVLVALYLYTQRHNQEKPELPSRQFAPPVPPPRPPPRAKGGGFRSALMGLISRDSVDKGDYADLPGSKTHRDEEKQLGLSKKQWSLNDPSLDDYFGNKDRSAVVEVEVLAQEDSEDKDASEDAGDGESEEDATSVEETPSRKGAASPVKPTAAAEYAAVNYDEKRRSRLLKEQDSTESASTTGPSPVPDKEHESSKSPTPPTRSKRDISEKTIDSKLSSPASKRTRDRRRNEEPEKPKPEETEPEKKDKKEDKKERSETKKEEDDNLPGSRRRRARAEEPPPPEEEKPALRRVRRF